LSAPAPTALAIRFGALVRRLREERGWSQEEFAEYADLNRGYIGEIERGGSMPSLGTVGKLACALGLRPSLLMSSFELVSTE
jgi:XRE family transcriptional regulator, regulator of sulfur utilization